MISAPRLSMCGTLKQWILKGNYWNSISKVLSITLLCNTPSESFETSFTPFQENVSCKTKNKAACHKHVNQITPHFVASTLPTLGNIARSSLPNHLTARRNFQRQDTIYWTVSLEVDFFLAMKKRYRFFWVTFLAFIRFRARSIPLTQNSTLLECRNAYLFFLLKRFGALELSTGSIIYQSPQGYIWKFTIIHNRSPFFHYMHNKKNVFAPIKYFQSRRFRKYSWAMYPLLCKTVFTVKI